VAGGRREEVIIRESASSPFVGFGDLDNNTLKGLFSLLSVEHESRKAIMIEDT
jgi:hypothetical protein